MGSGTLVPRSRYREEPPDIWNTRCGDKSHSLCSRPRYRSLYNPEDREHIASAMSHSQLARSWRTGRAGGIRTVSVGF
jgi:hypothetical protein